MMVSLDNFSFFYFKEFVIYSPGLNQGRPKYIARGERDDTLGS